MTCLHLLHKCNVFFTNDVHFYQGYIVLTLGVIVKDDEKRNEQAITLKSVIFCQVKAPLFDDVDLTQGQDFHILLQTEQ